MPEFCRRLQREQIPHRSTDRQCIPPTWSCVMLTLWFCHAAQRRRTSCRPLTWQAIAEQGHKCISATKTLKPFVPSKPPAECHVAATAHTSALRETKKHRKTTIIRRRAPILKYLTFFGLRLLIPFLPGWQANFDDVFLQPIAVFIGQQFAAAVGHAEGVTAKKHRHGVQEDRVSESIALRLPKSYHLQRRLKNHLVFENLLLVHLVPQNCLVAISRKSRIEGRFGLHPWQFTGNVASDPKSPIARNVLPERLSPRRSKLLYLVRGFDECSCH